jgi:hypothetical protein
MLSDTFDHRFDDKGGLGPGGGENVFAERAPITDLPQPELGCVLAARRAARGAPYIRLFAAC